MTSNSLSLIKSSNSEGKINKGRIVGRLSALRFMEYLIKKKNLYQKVVEGNRGGFCYELNGLFNELLKTIGFQTRIISASVINKEGKVGPPFDHAAIIVNLDKRWLVDIGYGGDSFVLPKELTLDIIQKDVHDYYKFTKHNENGSCIK